MRQTMYWVRGLTCGACLAELMERVRSMVSVWSVKVDLVEGGASRLVLTTGSSPQYRLVRAAVETAGFSLSATPVPSDVSAEVER